MADEIILPEVLASSGFSLDKHVFRYRADRDISKMENGKSIISSLIIEEMERYSIWHSAIGALNDPFEIYAKQNLQELDQMTEKQKINLWVKTGVKQGNPQLMITNHDQIQSFYKQDEREFEKILANISKNDKDFDNTVNKIRNITGVACFSSVCNSRLMWGYYCNGLSGVCLVYNSDLLLKQQLELIPVKYSDVPFELNVLDLFYKYKSSTDEYDLSQIVRTKHSEWRHEAELRSVVDLSDQEIGTGRLIEMNSSCIEGVIIGRKVRDDVKNAIIKLSKSIGFKVFMADVDYKLFGVKIS